MNGKQYLVGRSRRDRLAVTARRHVFVLAYAILLAVLLLGSSPRRVGDGGEYLAMAENLQRLKPPSLTQADIAAVESHFQEVGSGYEVIRLTEPRLRGDDGRQDLFHFWFYPALAAPWLWILNPLGLNPTYAFTIVNTGLLLLAAGVVARRLPWAGVMMIFASPILWWIDKPHPDVFAFSLLTIAVVLVRERPWWSMVCAGAAATQYPPLSGVVPLIAAVALVERRDLASSWRFWAGAAAGALLAASHPLYYLLHLGRPTGLGATVLQLPSLPELLAPLVDLNVGLLLNFPPVLIAGGALAIAVLARHRRLLASPAVLMSLLLGLFFLVVFAQVNNTNHGGTPGMMRWSLWLIPLAIPLLDGVLSDQRTRSSVLPALLGLAALGWAVVAFHPGRSEDYLRPTRVAADVWERYPGLENPPGEIFLERSAQREGSLRPVATPSCSKVLLIEGRWPPRCARFSRAERVPPGCIAPSALCYANRSGSGYDFVAARY